MIKFEKNRKTIYEPVGFIPTKGQKVKVGEEIGKAGNTGRSTGTHLHYEVLKDGKRVNPSNFLSLK